jgi:hypothetical protein
MRAGASLIFGMETEVTRDRAVQTARRMRSARGAIRLRVVVWTAILAALVYISFKIIPPYYSNYQLEDDLHEEALFSLGKYNDDTVRDRVFQKMKIHGIDATKESIHIQQNDVRGLKILVDYTVTVDLKVYDLHLHFTPSSDNQSLVQ